MPQIQLPIFPNGSTPITSVLVFEQQNSRITYFNGLMPVFFHDEKDLATFRMITSQFVVNGNVTQSEITKAFGVPQRTVKRYVKLYREQGAKGFYAPRITRGAAVLTGEALKNIQQRLDEGQSLHEAAVALGLKPNTVNKALHAGKLHRPSIEKKLQN